MRFLLYRYGRRQLAALRPHTALGRTVLYLLLATLALYLLEITTRVAGWTGTAELLNSWGSLLSFLVVILGSILAIRWVRQTLLWRLRHRLLVTYVFVGLVPLLLVVLMAGIAGYLLTGQFATYVAVSDLQAETKRLAGANAAVASEIGAALRRGQRPSVSTELVEQIDFTGGLEGLEIRAWHGGAPIRVIGAKPEQITLSYPAWLEQEARASNAPERVFFQGFAAEGGRLFIRAATAFMAGGRVVVLVSSLPVEGIRLAHLSESLGIVSLYPEGVLALDVEGRPVAAQHGAAQTSQFEAPQSETVSPDPQVQPAEHQRVEPVSGGQMPAPRGWYDKRVGFVSPLAVLDWNSGESMNFTVGVETRLSVLYNRLFLRIGPWANVIFTFLAVVSAVLALILLVALFIGLGLSRTITRSVAKLYNATQRVNAGDFSHRIGITSKDQLAALESSFNMMTASLERSIAEQKEKERLQSELAIAQEVQAQLFPKDVADLATLEVHGFCRPARIVSGDYYDFLPLAPERLGIAVGDISGKGISAALLMATLHSAVRAFGLEGVSPLVAEPVMAGAVEATEREGSRDVFSPGSGALSSAALMALLNRHLYRSTSVEKYATLFLSFYDEPTRTLTYSNAGHLPPLLVAANGQVRRLDQGGLVIGLFDGIQYEEHEMRLRPGDIFVAFSDGVTEAENEYGEFGEDRLVDLVRDYRRLPLARLSETVVNAVLEWTGSSEQADDITLVLARAR